MKGVYVFLFLVFMLIFIVGAAWIGWWFIKHSIEGYHSQ